MKRLGIPIASLLLLSTAPLVANADLREQYQSNGECSQVYRSEKLHKAGTRTWYRYVCVYDGSVYNMNVETKYNGEILKRSGHRAVLDELKGNRFHRSDSLYYTTWTLSQWSVEGSHLIRYFCYADIGSKKCDHAVDRERYVLMSGDSIQRM